MDSKQGAPTPGLEWRISSRCNGGNCVQVAFSDGMVALRDSKNPSGGHQLYSPAAWSDFIAEVKAGKHDVA